MFEFGFAVTSRTIATLILLCGLCAASGAELRRDTLDGWHYSVPAKYLQRSQNQDPPGWHCREYTPGGKPSDDQLLEVCAGAWRATGSSDIVLDHPGMGREEGHWYGYGYGPRIPAQELSTKPGRFGWEAVVFCGISDRAGFHAAGGEGYDGFIVQDSLHVLTAEFSALPLERTPNRILWVRQILLSAWR
jgi:hypothetical protein